MKRWVQSHGAASLLLLILTCGVLLVGISLLLDPIAQIWFQANKSSLPGLAFGISDGAALVVSLVAVSLAMLWTLWRFAFRFSGLAVLLGALLFAVAELVILYGSDLSAIPGDGGNLVALGIFVTTFAISTAFVHVAVRRMR
jgi:hypothetical protein